MAIRRSFKSDDSFLEKISIGAIGTQRVLEDLTMQGHTPIELERGSRSFKLWKQIKIKRVRVPDLLCTACSRRIESRAKTSLEISMSHSLADPERGWDRGLDQNDFVAFVVCQRSGEKATDWQANQLVQYVSVRELRMAQDKDLTFLSRPKGSEEGFETRIYWPSSVVKQAGEVITVNDKHIQYRREDDKRVITLRLEKQGQLTTPLVKEGDKIVQNQIVASVVPVTQALLCLPHVTPSYYLEQLTSASLSSRYTAVKALGMIPHSKQTEESLLHKLQDTTDHIYVRLEAAASLAKHSNKEGWVFIEECLKDEYLQNRLETVILLTEIPTGRSQSLLSGVLIDSQQHPEIRAGAAWALGELQNRESLDLLINSFGAVEETIRVEAARALAKLASRYTSDILAAFPQATVQERPGIAWALSKSKQFRVEELLDKLIDTDARQWIAFIIGSHDEHELVSEIEDLRVRDPEVYFAVSVLWKIMTSWVYNLEEHG